MCPVFFRIDQWFAVKWSVFCVFRMALAPTQNGDDSTRIRWPWLFALRAQVLQASGTTEESEAEKGGSVIYVRWFPQTQPPPEVTWCM